VGTGFLDSFLTRPPDIIREMPFLEACQ